MASVQNPQTFEQWLAASQELATVLKNKKSLPITNDYAFTNTNVTNTTELIKTLVVGGLSLIPTIGNPLSILVSAVWSHIIANSGETTFEVYNKYRDMIKATIDQSIDTYDASNIKAILSKIKTLTDSFVAAKAALAAAPTVAANKTECADSFDDLEDYLRLSLAPLSDLRKEGWEAQELAAFALLATLHLLLLKEGYNTGAKWLMTTAKIDGYLTFYNSTIIDYMQHCKYAYYKGVAKIKALGIDGVMQFNKLNYFRGHCARFVFDYVNLWIGFQIQLFPDGVYNDNVRYVFSDVIGRPIDPSQAAKPDKPYYYPSCDFLENIMISREWDLYQKEFKRVEFTHDQYWMYSIQSFYNDPSIAGEKAGDKQGNQSKTGGMYLAPANNNAQISTFTGTYDVQPRSINLSNCVSTNQMFTQVDLGQSYSTLGMVKDTEMDYISCHYAKDMTRGGYTDLGAPVTVTASNENHKVATFRGFNQNNEVFTTSPKSGSDYAGVLDSFVVGMLPINIYNDNVLFPKIATIINCQKFFNRENTTFCRDFFLPTVHAMCINVGGKLRFRFKLSDSTIFKYYFGIRYFYSNTNTNAGSVLLRNANGVDIYTLPLDKCTPDTGSTNLSMNQIRYKRNMTSTLNLSISESKQITLVAQGGPLYVHSIFMYPAPLVAAA